MTDSEKYESVIFRLLIYKEKHIMIFLIFVLH